MIDLVKIPYMKYYKHELEKSFDMQEVEKIKQISEKNYADLLKDCNDPSKIMLKFWLKKLALPTIAVYRTMLSLGYEPDEALKIIKNSLVNIAKKITMPYRIMSYLPFSYQILRLEFNPKFYELIFPSPAWISKVIENSSDKIVVYFNSCFFYKVFTHYGAPELTPSLCNMDNIMFSGLSKIVEFKRTKILGNGDEVCNFQLIRKK